MEADPSISAVHQLFITFLALSAVESLTCAVLSVKRRLTGSMAPLQVLKNVTARKKYNSIYGA